MRPLLRTIAIALLSTVAACAGSASDDEEAGNDALTGSPAANADEQKRKDDARAAAEAQKPFDALEVLYTQTQDPAELVEWKLDEVEAKHPAVTARMKKLFVAGEEKAPRVFEWKRRGYFVINVEKKKGYSRFPLGSSS